MVDQQAAPQVVAGEDAPAEGDAVVAVLAAPDAPEADDGGKTPPPPRKAATGAQDAPQPHEGYRVGSWSGIPQYIEDATGYTTFDENTMRERLGLPRK